ncbi:MAG: zf-HC2 domain-containing protein [Acidobacteria bacterium]|nr:zf-HC2 domain-containing protein [Acidobacteriota bacterium]
MEKTTCGEPEALVEYLYGEIDADTRTRLDTHLVSCAECRETLDGLRGTRAELAAWSVPERPLGFALAGADTGRPGARPWWSSGALAAAAVILLAVAAAIANLEITYGSDGVTLRTGWSRTPEGQTAAPRATSVPAGAPAREATPVSAGAAPWRADLGELERRLRTEFRSAAAPSSARAASPGPDAARLLQQVQDLIEQSELRQRRELALRMAQVVRDFDTQRQTDLVRIQQGIGQIEGNTAADRQLLNYLVRASQRQ